MPGWIRAACILDSATDSYGSSCSRRYIRSDVLYKDLYECNSGPCYARKIESLLSQSAPPLVIVYPQAEAARAEARAGLRGELSYAIGKMGEYVGDQKSNGVSGLPSVSEIRGLMESARRRLDAIDVRDNESDEDVLRRLGLNDNLEGLVRLVRKA